MTPTRTTKHQRQHRIVKLLETKAVGSQAHLVDLLVGEGIVATQATVSRDLEELGALKVRLPGGDTAYALPELPSQQVAPEDHLRRVLGEWVVELDCSANLVVLRTPPGSAHVVGSALDRSGFFGVIGTVAGDDTVLVIAAEAVGGASVRDRLAAVSGLAGPGPSRVPDPTGQDGPARARKASGTARVSEPGKPENRAANKTGRKGPAKRTTTSSTKQAPTRSTKTTAGTQVVTATATEAGAGAATGAGSQRSSRGK